MSPKSLVFCLLSLIFIASSSLSHAALQHHVISTPDAPKAIGPYNQATTISGQATMIYASGQIAIDPKTQKFAGGTIEEQTNLALSNLAAVFTAAGSSLDHVTKVTVYLQDLNDFAAMNGVYAKYFNEEAGYPARAAIQVAGLPLNASVEIEAIGYIP